MADPSFDVVSKIDGQEVDNAVNQTAKELAQRGLVCLVPDYPSFGDYAYDFAKSPHPSGSIKAIWNNIRGVKWFFGRETWTLTIHILCLSCVDGWPLQDPRSPFMSGNWLCHFQPIRPH